MKKRILCTLTAMAMAAALLAGCGGSGDKKTEAAQEKTEAQSEASEAGADAVTEAVTEADKAGGDGNYTIAMITYSLAEEFGVDVIDGAQAKADELGVELVYMDPAGDMQKDISIMEDLISQGVDAICIAPVDADAIEPYIDQARAAGIVVVNWDIETDAEVDAKVLDNNAGGGAMDADYLVEKMGKEGKVLIVSDLESVTSTWERILGFQDRLKEIAPDVEIVEQLSSGTRDTHRTTVENMLQAHTDITAIFCPDGDRTLGAYVACEANERQDVLIVGYDATPEQKEIMKKDGPDCNMIAVVDLHPKSLGSVSLETAYKILQGETVEPVQQIEISLMTAEAVANGEYE
ncbi:MAG: sugar ABC transporter substrate-binding protein [Lachnospiraceae bacterium]|nr:sugar ABC transporter substrate-binding protein [Lachnospiraceae bacterium]